VCVVSLKFFLALLFEKMSGISRFRVISGVFVMGQIKLAGPFINPTRVF
jgi:hypothetical protein